MDQAALANWLLIRHRAKFTRSRVEAALREHPAPPPGFAIVLAQLKETETIAAKEVNKLIQQHPVWPWISQFKGAGPITFANILIRIDIAKPYNVSGLWQYCGVASREGKLRRRFNRLARGVVEDMCRQFIEQHDPHWRPIYERYFAYYNTGRPVPHAIRMARRKLMKEFLKALWNEWRPCVNKPVGVPSDPALRPF